MNLRQLEIFRAVMSTGTTTEAARLLHVSQPGISRMIRHLESRMGVALFERRSGRLTPTAEARALHAEIEKVYRGVQHLRDFAAHLRFGTQATLRVLASANTALQLVPRSIATLANQHAGARVLFESVPAREVLKLLVSEEADLAVTSAAIDHPALEIEPIGHWQLLCALPQAHPLALRRRAALSAVLASPLVTYSPEAPQSGIIDRWIAEHGRSGPVTAEVRSGLAACAIAATGAAIAFVDDLSARAHRPEGLCFAAIDRTPSFPIWLVRNRHRPMSRLARAFGEIVKSELIRLQASPLPEARLRLTRPPDLMPS